MHPFNNFSQYQLLKALFQGLGPATQESSEQVKQLQRLYAKLPDSNAFYLTVSLPGFPRISWTHNLKSSLGYRSLNFEEYLGIIHPEWRPIYLEFGIASYRVARRTRLEIQGRTASYRVDVPIQRADGSYAWFSQLATNGGIDAEGHLVSHVNAYRYINEYHRYRPSGPLVTVEFENRPDLSDQLQRISYEACRKLFLSTLLDSEMAVLDAYRYEISQDPNRPVTSRHIAAMTQLSVQTVKKYNSRILEKARDTFPVSDLRSLEDFARLLTGLFGPILSPP